MNRSACTCLPATTYFPAEPDEECPVHGEPEPVLANEPPPIVWLDGLEEIEPSGDVDPAEL